MSFYSAIQSLLAVLELMLILWPAACRSLKAHYLKSYRSALGGVLRAQFCPLKAFVGGRRAALTLTDSPQVSSYLCSTGKCC